VRYKHYERVENGDLNVIVPGKFVAFSGPSAVKQEIADGIYTMTPEDYHDIFRKLGVTAIVRLNKKVYDRRQFTDAGFRHYDMYFIDGGTPSEAILRRFIEVAESEQGALAVHCKAGLGRTGTLMALYIMKHFRFTAQEVIAYMRVCRPGMVIGPQQYFLKEWEQRMWKLGEMTKKRSDGPESPLK
jgi:cell division cycle 14